MKLLRTALAGVFLAAVVWQTPDCTYARESAPFAPPVTFGGTTFCADCPGIRLTLTLQRNGTFNLRRVYLERPPATTSYDHGTWRYERASSFLVLRGEAPNPQYYRVVDARTLQPLDAQGKPLPKELTQDLKRLPHVDEVRDANAK